MSLKPTFLTAVALLIAPSAWAEDVSPVSSAASDYEAAARLQGVGEFAEAAERYERYAKLGGDSELEDAASVDALRLRLALGEFAKARALAKGYADRFTRPAERTTVARFALSLAEALSLEKDWRGVLDELGRYRRTIDVYGTAGVQIRAHALLGRAYAALGDVRRADREYAKVIALYTRPLGSAVDAVGEALFYQAEKLRVAAERIEFPVYRGKGKSKLKGFKKEQEETRLILQHINTKVASWMKRKEAAIKKADAAYKKILDLTPAAPPHWVIRAGERVGELWANFVLEFRAAPYPAAWHEPQEIVFETQCYGGLDRVSESEKMRARGAYLVCLNTAVNNQIANNTSRLCEIWLARNYKHDFHLIDEFQGYPNRQLPLWNLPPPVRIGGEAIAFADFDSPR